MGTVLRTEHLFFKRQWDRIHTQLYWEIYEKILGKILVNAVRFELEELGAMSAEQRARIEESW